MKRTLKQVVEAEIPFCILRSRVWLTNQNESASEWHIICTEKEYLKRGLKAIGFRRDSDNDFKVVEYKMSDLDLSYFNKLKLPQKSKSKHGIIYSNTDFDNYYKNQIEKE